MCIKWYSGYSILTFMHVLYILSYLLFCDDNDKTKKCHNSGQYYNMTES